MKQFFLFVVTLTMLANFVGGAQGDDAVSPAIEGASFESMHKVLESACGECHMKDESFSLTKFNTAASLTEHYDGWMRVRQRLADHSMPPAEAKPLEIETRLRLVDWIGKASREAVLQAGETAGPPMFRRLARHEYSNTIRDLLEVHLDAGHNLPQDLAGGEGFNNASETLIISPIHAEKYVEAATEALEYAARDSRARERLFPVLQNESLAEADAARENLRRLADRAFRKPVTTEEAAGFFRTYKDARDDGLDYHQAAFYAMRAILVSAEFLFISEAAPAKPNSTQPLTDHELANRLSYFLWASMPDDQLRKAADEGRLHEPDELCRQTLRMLADPGTHINDSMIQFVGQWLGTDDWGRTKAPDKATYPWIQDHHVSPMRNQPVYIFESMLKENDSLLALIDSDWTFLNLETCSLYKVSHDKLEKKKNFAQHLLRVKLPDEYRNRAGLLGCGAVMGVTSYPQRTSPVLRGAWVMDKLLGAKLPPPPPNVPPLEESEQVAKESTVRNRLEHHRANPTCASCHDRIDPIGFALENFDMLGRWRENDSGGKIDAQAKLLDGTAFDGLAGLKSYLLTNKEQFVRHLTEKMLGYSLARGLRPSDLCTVEKIVERIRQNDFKSQELILGIVLSEPFLRKRTAE